MSRAAYMREYRARKRLADDIHESALVTSGVVIAGDLIRAEDRIRELEAEVARLKRELAARPTFEYGAAAGFNTRPFTPVPKPGKGK